LVGIVRYFTGIYHTDTKGKLAWYISVLKFWRQPFFTQKGGFGSLFDAASPPLKEKWSFRQIVQKRSSCQILKTEFPPKGYSNKNINQNTNHRVPVTYQYQPDNQYGYGIKC
jgi:hypothetical protein